MRKEEAILLMEKGVKITHSSFEDHEWMTIFDKTDMVVTEDGYMCSPHLFWHGRQGMNWNNGYSIFEDVAVETAAEAAEEDLIAVIEKNLIDYKRSLYMVNYTLEVKADITRKRAIEIIKVVRSVDGKNLLNERF